MTEPEFWSLIEQSRESFDPNRRDGNMGRQVKRLEQLLRGCGPDSIARFGALYSSIRGRAYSNDLWACAYIREGCCSDDAFMDFRAWMVSMGERPFLAMLESADNVADYCDQPGVESIFFEEFSYVAGDVYKELVDPEGIPDSYYDGIGLPPLAGNDWDPNDIASLQSRFPRMWTKRCRISWPN